MSRLQGLRARLLVVSHLSKNCSIPDFVGLGRLLHVTLARTEWGTALRVLGYHHGFQANSGLVACTTVFQHTSRPNFPA